MLGHLTYTEEGWNRTDTLLLSCDYNGFCNIQKLQRPSIQRDRTQTIKHMHIILRFSLFYRDSSTRKCSYYSPERN